MLEDAIEFATKAHGDQKRKNGRDLYVGHPIRVMEKLRFYGIADKRILAAAVLHDVVEDTPVTLAEIRAAFGEMVASIVAELTKDKSLGRRAYVNRFESASPEACLIKMVDRTDNLNDWDGLDPAYRATYAAEGLAFVQRILHNEAVKARCADDIPYDVAFELALEDLTDACKVTV